MAVCPLQGTTPQQLHQFRLFCDSFSLGVARATSQKKNMEANMEGAEAAAVSLVCAFVYVAGYIVVFSGVS